MRKFVFILGLLAIFCLPMMANISAICVQPKGQLQGTINQLEAQGWTLESIDCIQVSYLVPPTPPYVNRILNITMQKVQCPPAGQYGPCILQGTATFSAEEVVVNNNGNTQHRNVSDIRFAL